MVALLTAYLLRCGRHSEHTLDSFYGLFVFFHKVVTSIPFFCHFTIPSRHDIFFLLFLLSSFPVQNIPSLISLRNYINVRANYSVFESYYHPPLPPERPVQWGERKTGCSEDTLNASCDWPDFKFTLFNVANQIACLHSESLNL